MMLRILWQGKTRRENSRSEINTKENLLSIEKSNSMLWYAFISDQIQLHTHKQILILSKITNMPFRKCTMIYLFFPIMHPMNMNTKVSRVFVHICYRNSIFFLFHVFRSIPFHMCMAHDRYTPKNYIRVVGSICLLLRCGADDWTAKMWRKCHSNGGMIDTGYIEWCSKWVGRRGLTTMSRMCPMYHCSVAFCEILQHTACYRHSLFYWTSVYFANAVSFTRCIYSLHVYVWSIYKNVYCLDRAKKSEVVFCLSLPQGNKFFMFPSADAH